MVIVEKYGGSSVATVEQIKAIAESTKKKVLKGNQIVIVASAMGKTTNNLISLAKEITANPNLRELDSLMSIGEIKTVALLSIALNSIGVKAISLTGRQAGIKTTNQYGRAFITDINPDRIREKLDNGYVVCVAGFQGEDIEDNITTLGRGGSDTTAVALAGTLNGVCEIYTDVDGVSTIDPRLYPKAKKLKTIGYDQMMDMAVNGAKVLETRCVELAKKYNVKIYLGKTLEKKKKGTYVMNDYFEHMTVTGMASRKDVGILKVEIEDHFSKFLEVLSKHIPTLEMFNQTSDDGRKEISFACDESKVENIIKENNIKKWAFFEGFSKITIIGVGFSTHFSTIQKIYKTMEKEDIDVYSLVHSETVISIIVKREDYERAVNKLVKEFKL